MVSAKNEGGLKSYGLIYKEIQVPYSLNDVSFHIIKKGITIPQAYDANKIARTIRGENDAENAIFSRTANFPFGVPYRVGEACAVKSNFSRYVKGYQTVFLDVDKSVPQSIITDFLDAMTMLEYKGDLWVPNYISRVSGLIADVKKSEIRPSFTDLQSLSYKYRDALFVVKLYSPEVVDQKKKTFDKDVLVIDFRIVTNLDGAQYANLCSSVSYTSGLRIQSHDQYKYNYVFIMPLVEGMSTWIAHGKDKPDVYLRSGYHMTNLLAFYSTVPPQDDAWSYDLLDAEQVLAYCSASALMTILRCTYKFSGQPPNYFLVRYGFKPLPISVKGMSKIGSNVLLTMKLDVGVFDQMSTEELRGLFDSANTDQRSDLIDQHPELMHRILAVSGGSVEKKDKEPADNGGGSSSTVVAPTSTVVYEAMYT